VEFGAGLDPSRNDSESLGLRTITGYLELSYPIRLPVSSRYSLAPARSTNLTTPFTAIAPLPIPGADGLARAVMPLSSGSGFMRLQVTIP